MSKHTQGPWRAKPMGGFSTVIVETKPVRGDIMIPAYGYQESAGHCIGYPFSDDNGAVRLDFVCFSHDDARLIAAAPSLAEEGKALVDAIDEWQIARATGNLDIEHEAAQKVAAARSALRAVIAEAEGRPNA